MTDLDTLLAAVHEAPEDDAPRLVYADALLERGDVRGELIVRQCRGDAAAELIEQHGDRWLGELAPFVAASTFERGFLAKATLQLPDSARDMKAVIGHPVMRTVRELRGPIAVAIHPSMTALRVLHVQRQRDQPWRELFSGEPRPITELHYEPNSDEEWDQGGDVTATPYSGGTWTRSFSPDELAAISRCTALPGLRRLVIQEMPSSWFLAILRNRLTERVPVVESRYGSVQIAISRGVAAITVSPTAPPTMTETVLAIVRDLPVHLAIELHTGPRFGGREQVEAAAGPRLRR